MKLYYAIIDKTSTSDKYICGAQDEMVEHWNDAQLYQTIEEAQRQIEHAKLGDWAEVVEVTTETMNDNKYPFEEGDDYWTIEGIALIWSCWDDVSEELHDENPNREYFTEEEALDVARANGIIFTNRHSHEQQ